VLARTIPRPASCRPGFSPALPAQNHTDRRHWAAPETEVRGNNKQTPEGGYSSDNNPETERSELRNPRAGKAGRETVHPNDPWEQADRKARIEADKQKAIEAAVTVGLTFAGGPLIQGAKWGLSAIRGMRVGGYVKPYRIAGGHHIHQQAAFRGAPGYSPKAALSLSDEALKSLGATKPHLGRGSISVTQASLQRQLASSGTQNTMAQQTRIARETLVDAGVNPRVARQIALESEANLIGQGVTSPTRIPGW
jgi:hypothetical protein